MKSTGGHDRGGLLSKDRAVYDEALLLALRRHEEGMLSIHDTVLYRQVASPAMTGRRSSPRETGLSFGVHAHFLPFMKAQSATNTLVARSDFPSDCKRTAGMPTFTSTTLTIFVILFWYDVAELVAGLGVGHGAARPKSRGELTFSLPKISCLRSHRCQRSARWSEKFAFRSQTQLSLDASMQTQTEVLHSSAKSVR